MAAINGRLVRWRPGKYWTIFKTQLLNNIVYRGELISRSLSIVIFMVVFVGLWRTTYSATAIAELTLRQTLWYLMLAETIILSQPNIAASVAAAVKDGSIGYLLNKPYSFLGYQISVSMADSVLRLGLNIIAGGAVVWLSVGPPPPLWGWPLVAVAVVLAWMINFCMNAMIGLTAFLVEETAPFEWIYAKIQFILGGLLIPLDFFPAWLRRIAEATPFASVLYGPARLLVEPSAERFGRLLLLQLFWLGLAGLALGLSYRRSLRHLTINGG